MEIKKVESKKEWEEFVANQKHSTIIMSWDWSKLERETGSSFENYGLYHNSQLIGLIPIKTIKARRGSFIHLRHGPALDWTNQEAIEKVIQFLKDYAKEHKVHIIRLSPLLPNTETNIALFKKLGFKDSNMHKVDAELTLVIDVTKSEEELLADMRKTTRHSISKAEKLGIEVIKTGGVEYFEEFAYIYRETVKRQKWVPIPVSYIRKEYDIFRVQGQAKMFLSKYQGKFISAAIFSYYNGQSIYHASGSLSEYRDIPATYLLQWEAIKESKRMGMKYHNLWGVCEKEDQKHPWRGLSTFKRGFGGFEQEFIHAQELVIHPFGYLTRWYEWIERKLKGYK